jgi:cyanophycinase
MLHGGGEFLPGDEPVLRELLGLAPAVDGVVLVAIVPTAAARGRPDLAGAHGVEAFRRIAAEAGTRVEVEVVPVLEAGSAGDPGLADRLAAATLVYLPGGDPDLIPALYPGSRAWAAIRSAHAGGAVLAGASAGAMALGERTWTPRGIVPGLGLVAGCLVVPHTDARSWSWAVEHRDRAAHPRLGVLGIAERTGVVVEPARAWRVVGEGEARWLPPGAVDAGATRIASDGGSLSVPA